jgi:hypothetical protein
MVKVGSLKTLAPIIWCHISRNNYYSHRRANLQFHIVKICEKVTAGNIGGYETPYYVKDGGKNRSDGGICLSV